MITLRTWPNDTFSETNYQSLSVSSDARAHSSGSWAGCVRSRQWQNQEVALVEVREGQSSIHDPFHLAVLRTGLHGSWTQKRNALAEENLIELWITLDLDNSRRLHVLSGIFEATWSGSS